MGGSLSHSSTGLACRTVIDRLPQRANNVIIQLRGVALLRAESFATTRRLEQSSDCALKFGADSHL
jgi:hypothetical protein